ncbi:MAG: hypothetical protein JNM00_04440 [Flavobacteriales bacterium]|nr:hypothetical protein [Flavobacteriales bacterium]
MDTQGALFSDIRYSRLLKNPILWDKVHWRPNEFENGRWKMKNGKWRLDVGCWMLEAGGWMLDAGCWMLVAGGYLDQIVLDFVRTDKICAAKKAAAKGMRIITRRARLSDYLLNLFCMLLAAANNVLT